MRTGSRSASRGETGHCVSEPSATFTVLMRRPRTSSRIAWNSSRSACASGRISSYTRAGSRTRSPRFGGDHAPRRPSSNAAAMAVARARPMPGCCCSSSAGAQAISDSGSASRSRSAASRVEFIPAVGESRSVSSSASDRTRTPSWSSRSWQAEAALRRVGSGSLGPSLTASTSASIMRPGKATGVPPREHAPGPRRRAPVRADRRGPREAAAIRRTSRPRGGPAPASTPKKRGARRACDEPRPFLECRLLLLVGLRVLLLVLVRVARLRLLLLGARLRRLHVDVDDDLVAHDRPRLDGLRPVEAEVLAVDRRGGAEGAARLALHPGDRLRVGGVERDGLRLALHREVARDLQLVAPGLRDLRRLEGDRPVVRGVEEVGALEVVVAVLDA